MARRLAFTALFAALALHIALASGLIPAQRSVTDWVFAAVELGALALIAARAIAVLRNRSAWAFVAFGFAFGGAGDAAWAHGADTLCAALYAAMFLSLYL